MFLGPSKLWIAIPKSIATETLNFLWVYANRHRNARAVFQILEDLFNVELSPAIKSSQRIIDSLGNLGVINIRRISLASSELQVCNAAGPPKIFRSGSRFQSEIGE
jgi:hypothetical protein